MKKLLVIFGTRPEAIKMAPLVKRLLALKEVECRIMVTAQHREMLDQVIQLFKLPVHFDLNLMAPGQDLTDLTTKILGQGREVLKSYKPDLILVHGDTTTTFAASLAAFYQQIDVAHVEAGLRTFNLKSPFPEEMNRQFCSKVSRFHFAPTQEAKENLLKEGVPEKNISVTGNTGIDALVDTIGILESDESLRAEVLKNLESKVPGFLEKKFVLITGHRRENFGTGFENICSAIEELARTHERVNFIYPVHMNPNVRGVVMSRLQGVSNIHLIEPLDYLPFVYLMGKSYLILTDSGGIQEEAPTLGKPVLVMRDTTERPEAIKAGVAQLVGTEVETIVNSVNELLTDEASYKKMSRSMNPYGDGKACEKIIGFLKSCYI